MVLFLWKRFFSSKECLFYTFLIESNYFTLFLKIEFLQRLFSISFLMYFKLIHIDCWHYLFYSTEEISEPKSCTFQNHVWLNNNNNNNKKLEWFWPLQDGKLFFLHLEIMPSKEPQKEPSLTDEWCHYSIGWINA